MDAFKIILNILPIVVPIIIGILMAVIKKDERHKHSFSKIAVIVSACAETVLVLLYAFFGAEEFTLFTITDRISFALGRDELSIGFSVLLSCMFLASSVFATDYMKHEDQKEEEEQHTKTLSAATFFGVFLIVWGVLVGLAQSRNLLTFYLFYELMTLSSALLVIHDMTKEAIFATKKYIYYSIGGASMAVFGLAVLAFTGSGLSFVAGGELSQHITEGNTGIVLVAIFLMILGFGTKAGMFPMHSWLPSAHPVAPAPASAVLSAIITKAGVLGILRVIFYVAGPSLIAGTWVQFAFIGLSLITVFMGSLLAYKEDILKKRLAYSTVSQVSYVLFGIACLHPVALVGALLHVIFHAVLKTTLFLNAGAVIYSTHKTKVSQLLGIGKMAPLTMLSFTFAALGLVGIPPVCGFVSKWYLCLGALELQVSWLGYVGVAVLLLSALLTAGYLLSLTIAGFFPGEHFENEEGNLEANNTIKKGMIIVQCVLAVVAVLIGIFASPVYESILSTITKLF